MVKNQAIGQNLKPQSFTKRCGDFLLARRAEPILETCSCCGDFIGAKMVPEGMVTQ